MKTNNTIILGSGGFIGRNLAEKLLIEGHNPILVGPRRLKNAPSKVIQIQARITDFSILDDVIKPGTVIYYLINDMTPANSGHTSSDHIATNLTLFVKFLEWVRDIENVHVVYTSSGGTIYGECEQEPTPESAIPSPVSFYGLLKWTAECYLTLVASQNDFTYTIARIANPYGADQAFKNGQGVIPHLFNSIAMGKLISVVGQGEAIRDYIHIEDVITCLEHCGYSNKLRNQTVNVATGIGHSVLDVIGEVEALLGQTAILDFQPHGPGYLGSSVLDITLIKNLTGWAPKHSLKSGLRTYL